MECVHKINDNFLEQAVKIILITLSFCVALSEDICHILNLSAVSVNPQHP